MMRTEITAERYHDVSFGHRVAGHENKCAHLHGHNYRIHFTCAALSLDAVGRVLDFSVMKAKLCTFLEDEWDHRMLIWNGDRTVRAIQDKVERDLVSEIGVFPPSTLLLNSIVWVPFNPTAENIADYLLRVVGPERLKGTDVELVRVRVDETRKCSATAALCSKDWQ